MSGSIASDSDKCSLIFVEYAQVQVYALDETPDDFWIRVNMLDQHHFLDMHMQCSPAEQREWFAAIHSCSVV